MTNWHAGPLDASMPNTLCYRIDKAVREALAEPHGDFIDMGLIIRRKLEEAGFELRLREGFKP